MTDINPYIEAEESRQAKKRLDELFKSKQILRLCNDLKLVCGNYYAREPTIKNDTKDTFYQNLTQLNGECLNAYIDERGNNPSALEGINYAFKFIKERSKINNERLYDYKLY